MSNQRVCDPEHEYKIMLIHKGRENLYDDLIILCCESCINQKPFNDSRLIRERIKQ